MKLKEIFSELDNATIIRKAAKRSENSCFAKV